MKNYCMYLTRGLTLTGSFIYFVHIRNKAPLQNTLNVLLKDIPEINRAQLSYVRICLPTLIICFYAFFFLIFEQ